MQFIELMMDFTAFVSCSNKWVCFKMRRFVLTLISNHKLKVSIIKSQSLWEI